jgi:putative acetyltransferase
MIRQYAESDCEAVVDVWYAASLVATPFLSREFLTEERESIRAVWLQKADTWVFEIDREVVGFLSLLGNEVGGLFVHPDAQGRGVGTALMDTAADLRDELFLDVFEENAVGRRFYDSYGFSFEHKHVHEQTGRVQMRMSFRPG